MTMFRKVLIANRGEIACRVIRTCRRLGIATVAVYSDADAQALHVRMADEAVQIGPAPARESYLVAERIVEAARRTGAEAVHPGYGFLSERAEFAEACAKAGIVFIGPPASAIRAMGLKGAAKALMVKAGVPVVPGYHGDGQSADLLLAEAERIGWPVLIKAVAGGGGKGMRRVDSAKEFDAALAGAKREAAGAFGDDKVLIEKYLLKPRHIEVQVFADSHGNAIHLFERDCSEQRRHQKVIEEAPAPGMTAAMRAAMGKAAVAAAKAIGYVGAGTIEFIADVADGLDESRFYFMEMNTRLQVEHPVTEAITGQDLVEWQLRVAAGGTLPLAQEQVTANGHAVEARLYAENPARDFLPSTGTLLRLRLPVAENGLRIDSGVVEGDAVTPYYDPMIAKIIAHAPTREAALAKLAGAMEHVEIAGLQHNAGYLARILRHPAFVAGDVDTGFIPRHQNELQAADDAGDTLLLAALFLLSSRASGASPWQRTDGWRMNLPSVETLRIGDAAVEAERSGDGYRLRHNGRDVQASARFADGMLTATLDGRSNAAAIVRDGDTLWIARHGKTQRFTLPDPLEGAEADDGLAGAILAPMPGKILQVHVAAGASVSKGQPLFVLEAMKMEHTIAATVDGKVEAIAVTAGEQVAEGATLGVLAAA
jgi:3-methylcrotonyl-CoA carboxylase alpha subunit